MGKECCGSGKCHTKNNDNIQITQDVFEFLEDLIKEINDSGEQTDEVVNRLEKIIAQADIIPGDFFTEEQSEEINE